MKRWSIITDPDGGSIIENIDTRAAEAFHLELVNGRTGARRLVGIYSDRADADKGADWFGRIGAVHAEVTGPHVLAAV